MNYFFHDATHDVIQKKSGVDKPKQVFAVTIDNEDNNNRVKKNDITYEDIEDLREELNELKKFLKHYVVNVNLLEKPNPIKSLSFRNKNPEN